MTGKKEFWNSAAKDGFIYAGMLIIAMLITIIFNLQEHSPMAANLLDFLAISIGVYFLTFMRSKKMGDKGFSFSQSMSYILAIALCAGFIYGCCHFLAWRDSYAEALDIAIAQVELDENVTEQAVEIARNLINNPIVMVLATTFNVIVYSCFVGIITSVFVKRLPTIKDDEQVNKDDEQIQ